MADLSKWSFSQAEQQCFGVSYRSIVFRVTVSTNLKTVCLQLRLHGAFRLRPTPKIRREFRTSTFPRQAAAKARVPRKCYVDRLFTLNLTPGEKSCIFLDKNSSFTGPAEQALEWGWGNDSQRVSVRQSRGVRGHAPP